MTIVVARIYFDPFSHGPGSAIKLWHRDDRIDVDVHSAASAGPAPCVHIHHLCFVELAGHLVPQ